MGTESVLFNVSSIEEDFDVGARTPRLRREEIRFGPNARFHQNSRGKFYLTRCLASVCSRFNDCVQTAIGYGIMGMNNRQFKKIASLGKHSFEMNRLTAIAIAHQNFDMSMFANSQGPCSWEEISLFQRRNSSRVALNIYGISRRSENQYRIFPHMISDQNYSGKLTINLVVTSKIPANDEVQCVRYHVNFVLNWSMLMANNEQRRDSSRRRRHFCYICCAGEWTSSWSGSSLSMRYLD